MKRSSILLLAGAVTLAAGTALVARALMRPPPPITIVKEVPSAPRASTFLLVARSELAPGAFVDSSTLSWQEDNSGQLRVGQLSASAETQRHEIEDALAGAAVRRDIAAGEPVTSEALVYPGQPGFIAAVLSPGMRAISIPTSAVSSNAGLVAAGDWVDVILSLSRDSAAAPDQAAHQPNLAAQTILHRVRVLALNNDTFSVAAQPSANAHERAKQSSAPTIKRYETLTLEVTPEQAERLAVAKEIGTLQISMRGTKDSEDDEVMDGRVTRLGDTTAIFRGQAKAASGTTVKTYHGTQQGTISFGAPS